jgi:hypothetical protein
MTPIAGCSNVFDLTCKRYAGGNPVNNAIEDARGRGGGAVYLPAGTYTLNTSILVPFDPDPAPAIHLIGDGPELTKVTRIVGTHELPGLALGTYLVPIAPGTVLETGVYFVRVQFGADRLTARLVVLN